MQFTSGHRLAAGAEGCKPGRRMQTWQKGANLAIGCTRCKKWVSPLHPCTFRTHIRVDYRSLPAPSAEKHSCEGEPGRREECRRAQFPPMHRAEVACQGSLDHPRAVILEGQPRKPGNTVVLGYDKHDGHD